MHLSRAAAQAALLSHKEGLMANNWTAVDNAFPTFGEGESPYEQIKKLQDYMRQLTDQLKYSLNNISVDNWNSRSLESFSSDLTADYVQQLQDYARQVNRLNGTVSGYTAELKTVHEKLKTLEMAISDLGEALATQEKGLKTASEALARLLQSVVIVEGGVNLVGTVTINGEAIT